MAAHSHVCLNVYSSHAYISQSNRWCICINTCVNKSAYTDIFACWDQVDFRAWSLNRYHRCALHINVKGFFKQWSQATLNVKWSFTPRDNFKSVKNEQSNFCHCFPPPPPQNKKIKFCFDLTLLTFSLAVNCQWNQAKRNLLTLSAKAKHY